MRVIWILALVASTLSVVQGQDLAKQMCSADKSVLEHNYNSANVLLGGSLSIRNPGAGGLGCGSIFGGSMQYLEGTRFAINIVNNANSGQGVLPGVTFGMKLYDSCFSTINSVSSIQKLFPQSTAYQPYCANTSPKAMLGMIGPYFSSTAIKTAEYAKEVPVTIVSPSALTSVLSDSAKYPTFFRTISSVVIQAKAIASVLNKLQFKKVLALYDSESYGTNGYEQLLEASQDYDICVAQAIKVPTSASVDEIKNMLQSIGANNFVAGVISAVSSRARALLQAIQQIPELRQVQWIMVDFELNNPFSAALKQMRGAMVVMPKVIALDSFRDYYVGLLENPAAVADNPWFKQWYETVYGCTVVTGNANGCVQSRASLLNNFKQNAYVVPAIKAVFAYVKAFESFCPAGSGVCPAILQASPDDLQKALRDVDYTFTGTYVGADMAGQKVQFDVNGDSMDTIFSVIQYNNDGGSWSFKEVGQYETGQLTMNTNPIFYDSNRDNVLTTVPTALCAAVGCIQCITSPKKIGFHYTPGDVVIASIINTHMQSNSLFECGPNMESGLASIIAAQWAVGEYKRKNPSKLVGVSLGSLVADVCPTGAVATGFLRDLFSSSSNFVDESGIIISSRQNIYGFVDDTDEMIAAAIRPILDQYNLPEIQVGATGVDADISTFPLFSSAVPNDKVYFDALISLCRAKRWSYVQVLTQKDTMYESMAMRFRAHAAQKGVCVVSTSYFDDGSSIVLNQLISNPDVFTVVTFGMASHIKSLLNEIKSTGNSNKILIISGMAKWGTDPSYFDVANSELNNIITLGLRKLKNLDFENYLRGLTQSQIIANSFLTSLYEVSNKCSLISASRSKYARACSSTENFAPYQGNVPYVIQAIYNMADKLHEIIADVCENLNYNGLCAKFRGKTDIAERLGRELKNSNGIANGEGTDDVVYYVLNKGQYITSGSYDTEEKHLNSVPDSQYLDPKFRSATTCAGVCLKCQYLFSYKDVVYSPGDYLIAGTFRMSEPGPVSLQPYICGELNTKHGPLLTTAMLYALDRVNKKEAPVSVKGLTIGGLALDHCDNSGREKMIVSDIYSGFLHHSLDVDETKILSWMTDNTGSTREAAELLDNLDIPIVSPAASSVSLMNDYENVFRTIQGDLTTATALLKLARQLGFPYIQVVHDADSVAKNYKDTLVRAAEDEGICVTASIEMSDTAQAGNIVQQLLNKETNVVVLLLGSSHMNSILDTIAFDNAAQDALVLMSTDPFSSFNFPPTMTYPPLSIQLQTPKLSELSSYKDYLDSNPVDNIFFAKYYMKLHQCNLEGYYLYSRICTYPLSPITNLNRFEHSSHTMSTINAVYSIVDALDRTLKELCGSDYTAPCPQFFQASDKRQKLIQNLKQVSFIDERKNEFRFLQREGNVAFNVIQFDQNQANKVGSIASGPLNLDSSFKNLYKNAVSKCNSPCLECINKGLTFSLTPGDIYLGGMFDVHQTLFDPFSCGRINTLHGFLLLEAFHFALEQVNSKKGVFKDILKGVDIGGVGLDACSSQVRAGQLISNINNDLTILDKQGTIVRAADIDTYIGAYASTSSRYLARILNDLKIPQISYAAASNDLSDQRIYPYFFRTVPSNAQQAEAILTYLNEQNIRYIQVLYIDNTFGNSGKDELVKRAAEYKICVAQSVAYIDEGIESAENSKAVVATLLDKPAANTVVTFLETSYINSVLRYIRESQRAQNKLRFVGSDIWADNKEAIDQAQDEAVDSVTLKLDVDDVEEFENHIDSKTLVNSDGNPWFEEYYQQIHDCYTTEGNPLGYSRPCPQSITSIISSVRYQQDPNVFSVINAVFASALSIHQTLKDLCGDNYHTVCQAYRNNMDRHDKIRDNLEKVHFTDMLDKTFNFTDQREVDINYRFNAITRGPLGEVIYKQIGIYNSGSKSLLLSNDYTPSHPWNSGCDREDACEECPNIRDSTVRYTFYEPPNTRSDDPVIVAFFDIHEQGVDPYRCGKVNDGGFQQFMAFMYSITTLFDTDIQNKRFKILAVDTCSNPVRLDQDLFGLLDGTGLCNTDNFKLPDGVTISAKNIAAVVASGESNTMAAARLLEKLGITFISPNAISPLLDNKMYLARTSAPISAQMMFLSRLALEMGWDYMDVIYEEKWMGYYQWKSFSHQAAYQGLCLASPFVVSDGTKNQDIEDTMERLNHEKGSKVVVLFGGKSLFSRVMAAARSMDVAKDYVWILAGDMELDDGFVRSILSEGIHIVSIHRLSDDLRNFNGHVRGLTYNAGDSKFLNGYIPRGWFEEYFQMMKDCTLSGAQKPINVDKQECNSGSFISLQEQDKYLVNIVAAAYAAISGTRNFWSQTGTDFTTMAHRTKLRDSILQSSQNLQDLSITTKNMELKFNSKRWWDSGYVLQYWMGQLPGISMEFHDLTSYSPVQSIKRNLNITSTCSESESQGYCGCDIEAAYSAQLVASPDFVPETNRNYYKYDDDGERTYDWPIWAIVMGVLTSLGLLVTVVIFLVLLMAYPKKGGTSVLGYMVIVGIIGIYATNFAFFLSATEAVCGIRRFLMGVVYTICFAPLLIKAIDNWRFGHVDYADRRYSGISSSCALLMSAIAVVLIQCIIPIMWLILEHPDATNYSGVGEYGVHHDNDWCDPVGDYDLGLVLSFSFVVFLILITGIFSALSYGSETNNFEARWILFASIATAGCFLVWMIVTTNAKAIYRDPAVAIANFSNATILLFIIPLRKTGLMIQAKRNKDEKNDVPMNGTGPYDMYSDSYINPQYELTDYDEDFPHKPSEF